MKVPFVLSRRKEILLDFLLVLLFAAVLIRPFFKAKYTDKWGSIESTFISDARFLIDHWPHPQWQPLWYGGTRFDYVYPPALRYGTAIVAKVTGFWPVKAYHFYTSLFYCVGIAGVYLLVRVGTRSRGAAWLGAVSTALMSPSFLILADMRHDAWKLLPLRLGVLVKYGEGPHMSALAMIPIALAFTWLAFENPRLRGAAVALAALFSMAAAANNFYGATALAVFYPILVWSFWITRRDKGIVIPVIAIPVLTYALTAFWLVPSYFQITSINMKYVSEHGTTWSIWIALVVTVAFAVTSDKLARGKPDRTWGVFTAGCAVFFSLNVLGNAFFNFRIAGEPGRLIPELDLIYILGAVGILRWMWNRPGLYLRIAATVLVLAAFWTTKGYIRHAWHMFPLWPDYQSRVEYRVTDWLWKNMPNSRHYATGSVRFWFDAWHDLAQLGGGSEQGLLNGNVEPAQWESNLGPNPEPTILWMQCMGVDTIYVSDKRSQEMFKDFQHPEKLAGKLPVLWDDGQGNMIFGVPRRYPTIARVVDTGLLNAAKTPRFNDDVEYLGAYAGVLEKGPDSPVSLVWHGTDEMALDAKLDTGQSLAVQETYDPAWHAWAGGKPLSLHKDALGFMAIDAPPGQQHVILRFVTPTENYVGRVISGVAGLIVLGLIAMGFRRERQT